MKPKANPFLRSALLTATTIFAGLASHAMATNIYQWNGTTDTNWGTAGNWTTSPSVVTGSSSDSRLNVYNGANQKLIYSATQGTTVFANTTGKGLVIGSGTSGSMEITGGSFSTLGSTDVDAIGNSQTGTLTISGGSFIGSTNASTAGLVGGTALGLNSSAGNSTLTVSGTGSATLATLQLVSATSVVNLEGNGVLTVNKIVRLANVGTAGNPNTTFNFNGGTLKAGASDTAFMADLTNAYVKSGGAKIDTNGKNITIGQALLHDSALGATADGGLTKSGGGTLTLSGANTYTGGTAVNGGTLAVTNASALPSATAVTLSNGGTLQLKGVASGSALTWTTNSAVADSSYPGFGPNLAIDGSTTGVSYWATPSGSQAGHWIYADLGSVKEVSQVAATWFSGAGGYSPSSYRLQVSNDTTTWTDVTGSVAPVGASVTTAANDNASGRYVRIYIEGGNAGNNIGLYEFNAYGYAATNYTLGSLSSSDATTTVNLGPSANSLTVGDASSTTFAGHITGLGSLTKTGAGTLTLSGTNTYTGTTTVNTGTLKVSGSIANSAVTVNNDGTVLASGSTGTFGKSVTVNNGAVLAAGGKSAIGALVLDGSGTDGTVLNMASGSIFDWDLSANGGTPDQINFWNYKASDFALNGNTVNLNLSGTKTNGTYTVDLFKFYSDSGTSLMASGITNGLVVGTKGSGISAATFTYNGSMIGLTYTVVPEPTGALVGLLVGAGLLRRRRTA